MSNTNNDILQHIISAPNLNDANYGEQLETVFNNINSNFVTLANRDFVKGERGSSVEIVEYDIFDNTLEEPNYTKYGNLLINAIKSRSGYNINNETINSNNEQVSLFDNLGEKSGTLKMICNITSEDGINFEKTPISSLYYVFLDGRFANNKLNLIDESVFTDIEDLSCVLIYDENEILIDEDGTEKRGNFKILENAFPTIYYEREIGLCWKLNGNATGIPVKGPQGKAGEDAKLYIVKCTKESTNNITDNHKFELEVTDIFDSNGYTDINMYIQNNTNAFKANVQYPGVIYCNPNGKGFNYYFGLIKYNDNKLLAIVDSSVGIDTLVQFSTLENFFKNINIKNNDGFNAKGIYLPIEMPDNINTQKVHLLTSSSISNEEGNETELNTDIIWSPVNNINNLKIDDVSNKKLQVDKYLYLTVDTDLLTSTLKGIYDNDKSLTTLCNIIKSAFSSRNNILKYKLTNVIKTDIKTETDETGTENYYIDNIIFNTFTNNSDVSLTTNNLLSISSSAKCLLKTTINTIDKEDGKILKSENIGPQLEIDNINFYGKSVYRANDDKKIKSYELKYGDINNIDKKVYDKTTYNIDDDAEDSISNLLTKDNLNYYSSYKLIDKENNINVSDRYSTIPLEFADILFNPEKSQNKKGVYRWVLDFTYNEFDPIELKDSYAGKNRINNVYNTTYVDEDYDANISALNIYALFNTIFTITNSPIKNDNILWFNGIYKKLDNLQFNSERYLDNSVEGWELNTSTSIINFYKFIPGFNNSFAITDDTSLNLNYNVNISGDINNPNKNLTVHGNIIGEDLQIFGTANINNIENIYTKNNVICDNELKIGKNNDDNDYYTKINSLGEIDCSKVTADNVTADNVKTDNVTADNVTADNVTADNVTADNVYIHNDKINISADINNNGININYINQDKNNTPNICIYSFDTDNRVIVSPNKYSKNVNNIEEYINDQFNSSDNSDQTINIGTSKESTNTINRIRVNENKTYLDSDSTRKYNTGINGSCYGHKGHAWGPYYSHYKANEWTSDKNKLPIGNLYPKSRFYRYTLFPYWDIPDNDVSLMSTSLYTSKYSYNSDDGLGKRITDTPYITNICQVQVPIVENDTIDGTSTEKFLSGLYKNENGNVEFNTNLSSTNIELILNNENFTFFVSVFTNWSGGNNTSPEFINTSSRPSFVKLTLEASIIDENSNKIYTEYLRDTYDFPKYMIDKQWGSNNNIKDDWRYCFDLSGKQYNGPSITKEYITNQFNIKFKNITFDYSSIIKNFLNDNKQIKIDDLKKYKINLKVYTESRVSFSAGKACMRELWLTPVLYYKAKNFKTNKDGDFTSERIYTNKSIGITAETNWDNITLKPTVFKCSDDLYAKSTNTNDPWMSFDYLDKLCTNVYNTLDTSNSVKYGDLNLDNNSNNKLTDKINTLPEDEYYKQNGFNGNYNGNNFIVKAEFTQSYVKESAEIGNSANINQNGLFIVDTKNKIAGIYKKYVENNNDNIAKFCLFDTIIENGHKKVKDISIGEICDAIKFLKDNYIWVNTSSSLSEDKMSNSTTNNSTWKKFGV